jgi:predicted nucleic acid-binding protein
MKNTRAVIVDSGALYALFDRRDDHHKASLAWISASRHRTLVTNVCVLTEVTYLLHRRGLGEAVDPFLEWATTSLLVDRDTVDDLPRIRAIMGQYADLPADFTDASLVALAERTACFTVASVDRDFTIYRSASRRTFTNLIRHA